MTAPEEFAAHARSWINENFPRELANLSLDAEGTIPEAQRPFWDIWRDRLAEKGWGVPTWPKAYGGAGLSDSEAATITREMADAGALNHIPIIVGMGATMVGPTILEYGTDDQKARHLPGIASGQTRWCLGLSEPNAGSDLASLSTRAVDDGDDFIINGQKVWTSGAHRSQWCGAVVRTDPEAKKRNGISFVLLPMDQEGVEARLIRLISGASPFCETFFDDARAAKNDLLGPLNEGWSVVKRLLQHERQSQTNSTRRPSVLGSKPLQERAIDYIGLDDDGRLKDPDLRTRITRNLIDEHAHKLTIERLAAESKGKVDVSPVASILKNSNTRFMQARAELTLELMGNQSIGWEGNHFSEEELALTREWLHGKAMSIYGGAYEIQNNIISKNILGLPETTQQG